MEAGPVLLMDFSKNEVAVTTQLDCSTGSIAGFEEESLKVFLGIPYAKSPVKELRWEAPQRKEWNKVLPCKKFAGHHVSSVEDCLYLNIWTPAAKRGDKLPVLVWFEEESFSVNSKKKSNLNAAEFASRNRLVVVTVASRQGIFGFFNGSPLRKKAGAPAKNVCNFSMLDKIAALNWLHQNLTLFGGDAANLTISGYSAGATAVIGLLQDKRAQQLFSKAVCQNPQPGYLKNHSGDYEFISLAKAAENAEKLASQLAAADIGALKEQPPELILQCAKSLKSQNCRFLPVFDNKSFAADWRNPHSVKSVPLLIGFDSNNKTAEQITLQDYFMWCYSVFGDNGRKVLKAYPAKEQRAANRQYKRVASIAFYAEPVYFMAEKISGNGAEVYYYNFNKLTPSDQQADLFVSCEVGYVFGQLPAAAAENTADIELSSLMMHLWSNFIKSGNPNIPDIGRNNLFWPSFRSAKTKAFVFGQRSSFRKNPYLDSTQFFKKIAAPE